jgi:dephospho-CoA kinase
MVRVGLTGGMCCGKTTVAEMFRALGAHVIFADQIAHELMQPGTPVYRDIVSRFGREVLTDDGAISRPRLAQAAFRPQADGTNRIAELNEIIHPEVVRLQGAWMDEVERREPDAVAIVEAALIFEARAENQFDAIVVVTCRPEQKAERFAIRAKVEFATAQREVETRSASQLTDAEKVRRADYVIDNSGAMGQTERLVREVFAKLKARS